MLRVINFFCVALAGFACLALYHVSEETRVARVELNNTERQIGTEKETMKVLQADWQQVANPARIQKLAQQHLGLTAEPMKEYASVQLLPRLGQALPGNDNPISNASVVTPAPSSNPDVHLVAVQTGN
jgi:cell division protein FtsL